MEQIILGVLFAAACYGYFVTVNNLVFSAVMKKDGDIAPPLAVASICSGIIFGMLQ